MVLRALAALLCVIAAVWLALWYFIPAPPSTITIVAGLKGGAFEQTANQYREILARQHVNLEVRFVEVPPDVIKLIDNPKSGADAAFVFPGQNSRAESPDLLSLGRIYSSPYWIFYRADELDSLAGLKGKRLNIPFFGKLPTKILNAYGVNVDNTTGFIINNRAIVVLEVHNVAEAGAVLQKAGFRVLSQDETLAI